MKMSWKKIFTVSLLLATSTTWADDNPLTLKDCHIDGIKQQIKCGKLEVPENYQKPNGTKITVNFAIIPAIDKSENKEPFMFLAGGPGQAATELAAGLRHGFTEIRKTRDLVLVDQRGTGESHPLQCEDDKTQSVYQIIPEDFDANDVKECLSKLTGDLSQYNSENAIRDFEAVRIALGHDKINIYGGSYGTRAALVYMRMFPRSLRSVVLDSVGPVEVPIGLFGLSSARSFELLLENCKKDESCNAAYPELAIEFQQVVQKLEQSPITLDIPHPRLGEKTVFVVSKDKFISNIFMQLYSMQTRSFVPLIIHQANLGNYAPLAGIISQTDGEQGIYLGLNLNIVCNEDMPKISEAMAFADAKNNFGGSLSFKSLQTACPLWPTYSVEQSFYQPVTANIPTLILSGNLDPVTPPSNGEKSAATIPDSHHIVVENVAHIAGMSECGVEIINEFLSSLKPKELNEGCLQELPVETFMTSLNGSI
jgi:pimeloyl-ACP methyl ester carboxylesterase